MTRKVLFVAVAVALAAPAVASAETTITTVERPTEIRSWKGIGVFSVYDKDAGVYRLAITRVGGPPQILTVPPQSAPPQSTPFDADIGPDSEGEPAIVYSQCGRGRLDGEDCDIYRYSITRNVDSKITNADTDDADEVNPTIWKGRVAWVRRYLYRDDPTPYVYTRMLRSPRSQPSQRLPGVPTRRCSSFRDVCGPTKDGHVEGLELYGRWLALNVRYSYEGVAGVCGRKEVRLDTLDGHVRQVADQICGLSGQSYVGLSFDEGRLYWARFCGGDESGCRESNSGAFRYRLSTGDYALAGYVRKLTGFSYVDDNRVYEVRRLAAPSEPGICQDEQGQPTCAIVYTDPLSFRSTATPR